MHTQPLIFDYAKLFSNVDTFVIASHSYAWGNFVDFIRTPSLDHLWYREVSGLEPSHGTGIDDANVPAQLVAHLGRLDPRRRFVGLLHFYGTHQEYDSRAEDRLWGVENKIDRYDASIHYLDRNTAAVLDALGKAGRLEDTLIVFASDHGEAFGEKGYDGHLRTYYDVEARVPLWIHLPRALMTDRSVIDGLRRNADQPVSNADLVPTFLALTGLDRYAEIRAQTKRLLGRSIAGELPPDRPLLMQNYNDAGSNAMYVGVGLLEGRYKYLLRVEGGRSWEELYDLETDPEEAANIWSTADRSLRDSLHRELRAHRNSRVVAEKYLPKEGER
jgi:arylsulfatase A-like enzyme